MNFGGFWCILVGLGGVPRVLGSFGGKYEVSLKYEVCSMKYEVSLKYEVCSMKYEV